MALVLFRIGVRSKSPPGPRGFPLLGHIFPIPALKAWTYFDKCSTKYGPVMGFSLVGERVLVLNRGPDADELVRPSQAGIYSSHPQLIYASKYWYQSRRLIFMPYGDELRRHRAAFYQMLQASDAASSAVHQEIESTKLLLDILENRQHLFENIEQFSVAVIYKLTYGKRMEGNERDLEDMAQVIHELNEKCQSSIHLVDCWPFLDNLPDSLAPWLREALRGHEVEATICGRLAEDVEVCRLDGRLQEECFVTRLLEQGRKLGFDRKSTAYLAGTAFEAGRGTTSSEITWFIAAAPLYLQSVKLARKEMDMVLSDRIPKIGDLDNLPYCTALVKEVLRCAPSVPCGVSHRSLEDDEFRGYQIKKGTTVIPNIWGMHHDESVFQDSSQFDPSRFLEHTKSTSDNGKTLVNICLGRFLGASSVWIAVVRLIWAFNILPVLDDTGDAILPITFRVGLLGLYGASGLYLLYEELLISNELIQ
ncbi:cytochrome P450 [Neolentinus lepideus HHB14362 ss-1]|uniref:Cytochrome P450 n=1 Tax=Neolentinus lepideus HHB14362 ss-1 TaxID=1314782 RepID=A0A165VQ92_9AGAM|nr:cytochrome P450 [Neolentinus lepideus HHB14362 ss-1]